MGFASFAFCAPESDESHTASTQAENAARRDATIGPGGPAAITDAPPAPPPPGPLACPAGTSAVHGMCRTPQGYLRPLPEWVQALIEG